MKTVIRLILAAAAILAAVLTFCYLADNISKDKKYIVIKDPSSEIY